MYYIYHIPQRKEWGCTSNLNKRLSQLGYTEIDLDRVIIAGNIDKADALEAEMNIEYGYKWNPHFSYKRVLNMSTYESQLKGNKAITIEQRKKGGITQSKINEITGQWKSIRNLGAYAAGKKINTCPHCGTTGKGNGMWRWHGDNCKSK